MKIDLHVHSLHSNRPGEVLLRAVGSGECYTAPQRLYTLATDRGMDMVTITDHDTIRGALEIAHLPRTFISEEITAVFPEDGVKAHIVALDIDEAAHREIQRLRENIYELAQYLRVSHVPHFAAHPFSGPDAPFAPHHVQKLLLLFTHLEGINGTRDAETGAVLERVLDRLTMRDLERWAERHGITPVSLAPRRFLTGGSDDHGALSIARAYTTFDGAPATVDGFRDAFFAGNLLPGGYPGTGEALGHGIYSVTLSYFQNSGSRSGFNAMFDDDGDGDEAGGVGAGAGRARRIQSVVARNLLEGPALCLENMWTKSHTDATQSTLGVLGRNIVRDLFKNAVDELCDAAGDFNIEAALDAVPGILSAASMMLPYLFGYRYVVRDRETAFRVAEGMGFPAEADSGPRVAVFSDTGRDINGVALGLNGLIRTMRGQGAEVSLVMCGDPAAEVPGAFETFAEQVTVLPAIRTFPMPVYREYTLGVPCLIDVMDFLSRRHIELVQISTPGPVGMVALVAAKLCGLKVVMNYHTEIAEFARRLTGDAAFAGVIETLVGFFYRQADAVIVPSKAVKRRLRALGVREQICVIQRGVDSRRFSPRRRSAERDARPPVLLYVGRVSKEKGLDMLLSAFNRLRDKGVVARLRIVGDGPSRERYMTTYGDTVEFLGYQTGEALPELYASADLFVFPSATDTFGNAVLEAHASGLPAVVVDRGGPGEQVTDGVDGLVVPAEDGTAFEAAMARLIDDSRLRARLGASGRRRALSLTLDASARAHLTFYQNVWSAGRPAAGAGELGADDDSGLVLAAGY